jgi:hypothetical protein
MKFSIDKNAKMEYYIIILPEEVAIENLIYTAKRPIILLMYYWP